MTDDLADLRSALGGMQPPNRISQRPFDHDDTHLRALVRLPPGDSPEAPHLVDYLHDLHYGKWVQKDLLNYVLPFCLRAWRKDLRGTDASYGGAVEHLYPALVRIIADVLSPSDTVAVSRFMRNTVLSEIDDQRGLSYSGSGTRPYRWIRALAAHGVLFPDIEALWRGWWTELTTGRSVAAVQYISCLVYDDQDNPVFAPWTRNEGGGPPQLWEYAGHLNDTGWQIENTAFLRETLTDVGAIRMLARASERLAGEPERDIAARVYADAQHSELLERRCRQLPDLLEAERDPDDVLAWPDA